MKRLIMTIALLMPAVLLVAQQEKRYIHQGNQLYEKQKYAEAEASYKKSVAQSKQSEAGNFNLADAWYKQKKFDQSAQKFTEIAASAKSKSMKAQAFHNLGNSLFQSKKLEESIDAYKKALLNNPKDDQTRYNLAYAQEKLKQQQQQDKKDKNKDNKDQNKKDQNKQDQNKQDQNKKDQNKDQDKKDQDKKQDQNKSDQKDQQNGQQPNQLSKEDAERMLEALNQQEKNTQDKLKNKKATGVKGRIVKDW